jgi:hypothetical protein
MDNKKIINLMKRTTFTSLFILLVFTAFSQKDSSKSKGLDRLFKKAGSVFNSSKSGSAGSSLSSDEIVSGLKEALSVGATKSTGKLSAVDGFLKDAAVKILMPQQVRNVETKMRALGMGKVVDEAETALNRAAEDASKQAAPIFINAIKKMSIQDALGILRGSDTAATGYLRKSTTNDLTTAFRPIIDSSLKKVDATKYWKDVFTLYNKFSSTPVTTDINDYVTQGALKGIFYYVADEEKKIRKDPAARVTSILQKVFGGK